MSLQHPPATLLDLNAYITPAARQGFALIYVSSGRFRLRRASFSPHFVFFLFRVTVSKKGWFIIGRHVHIATDHIGRRKHTEGIISAPRSVCVKTFSNLLGWATRFMTKHETIARINGSTEYLESATERKDENA